MEKQQQQRQQQSPIIPIVPNESRPTPTQFSTFQQTKKAKGESPVNIWKQDINNIWGKLGTFKLLGLRSTASINTTKKQMYKPDICMNNTAYKQCD